MTIFHVTRKSIVCTTSRTGVFSSFLAGALADDIPSKVVARSSGVGESRKGTFNDLCISTDIQHKSTTPGSPKFKGVP